MRYLVKNSELNEFNMEFKKINNELKDIINEMDKLIVNIEWNGPAAKSFVNHYSQTMKYIDDIPNSLELCSNFLNNVTDDYTNVLSDCKNKLDDSELLNVGDCYE